MSAIVLCGGKSRRAGFDKQTIRIDSELIAMRIAGALRPFFDEVILVTNQPSLYAQSPYRVVEDIIKEAGPLGGIHAGLTCVKGDWAFVTACDMPNVSEAYLHWLFRYVEEEGATTDALVVRHENGMLEPMNALYAKRCLPQMEQALLQNERKIADLLLRIHTLYLPARELAAFGGSETLFFNMNTPQEIQYYLNQQKMRFPVPEKDSRGRESIE
jgi:molybdopterin-guanine dinucleotide biosynthesis protein A